MENTLILIDYDNVFVTLENTYRDFKNPDIMYRVISKIKDNYKEDNIISFKLFADFQKVHISNEGYDILRKNHVEIEHVFNGKNASDVILMINCMKYMMQYPHITKIVLVSSDSDLVPIFHEVQLLNKKLEVLYFDINTSDEHKKHIKEIGITSKTIEELLHINVYKDCKSQQEFYEYKTYDMEYFTMLLQQINNIIATEYNKYLKYNTEGDFENVGCINTQTLSIRFNELNICPAKETKPNKGGYYYNLIEMLQDKNVLVAHNYTLKGKNYSTFVLSRDYLVKNNIIITDLISDSSYPNNKNSK